MNGFTHEPPAGGTPEWYTPPEIFQALGLEFDLDPCAPPLPAAAWIPADAADPRRLEPGRVNFIPSDPTFRGSNGTSSNAGAPSCLLAFGDECAAALVRSGLGVVLVAEDACVRHQLDLWEAA